MDINTVRKYKYGEIDRDCKYNCRIKIFGNKAVYSCWSRYIFNPDKLELRKTNKKSKSDNSATEDLYTSDDAFFEVGLDDLPIEFLNDSSVGNDQDQLITSRSDSIKRACDKIFEIAYANDFKYFITFTLDQTKIDRYDPKQIIKKLNTWLANKVRRNNLQYIIVPEYHKDKAIHFHGLISGNNLKLKYSGHKLKDGRSIYNCGSWSFGFSTVVELDDRKEQVSRYITKYITKDIDMSLEKIFGRFYFSGGKGLKRNVETLYCNVDMNDLENGTIYDIYSDDGFLLSRIKYGVVNLTEDIDE